MSEYIQRNARVTTIEEYQLLSAAIKEQGGQILHTFTMRDKGAGLSVQYVVPVNKEN